MIILPYTYNLFWIDFLLIRGFSRRIFEKKNLKNFSSLSLLHSQLVNPKYSLISIFHPDSYQKSENHKSDMNQNLIP